MTDSESSETDSFYDAEDTICDVSGGSHRRSKSKINREPRISVVTTDAPIHLDVNTTHELPVVENQIEILTGDQLSIRDERWSRLEKLRRREEEERQGREEVELEEPNSTESSVEGIYMSGVRSLHPFKVVEPDSRSTQSDSKSLARSSQSTDLESRHRSSLDASNVQEPTVSKSLEDTKLSVKLEKEEVFVEERVDVDNDTSANACVVPVTAITTGTIAASVSVAVTSSSLVPDIVSSTHSTLLPKVGAVDDSEVTHDDAHSSIHPRAPPRRRKKSEMPSTLIGGVAASETAAASPTGPLLLPPVCWPGDQISPVAHPSPNSTVNCITKDLEETLILSLTSPDKETCWSTPRTQQSPDRTGDRARLAVAGAKDWIHSCMQDLDTISGLNINLACRGDYVVKPQDEEKARGLAAEEKVVPEVVQLKGAASEYSSSSTEISRPGTFSQDPAGSDGVSEARHATKSKSPVEDRKDSIRSRAHRSGGSGGQRCDGHMSGSSGGYHSGGSGGHHSSGRPASGKGSGGSDRRSAAGSVGSAGSDGGIIKQLGMYVRTKSDSGKRLTDQEILQQIKVKNLDTGTEMDLATAEEHLPQSINPLSLHIMRLTSEYTGTLSESQNLAAEGASFDSDTESVVSSVSDFEIGQCKKKRTLTKLFGGVAKSATRAAKMVTAEVSKRQRTREERAEEKLGRLATDISTTDGVQVSIKDAAELEVAQGFKRIQAHKSGPWDFENIQFGQDLSGHHHGPIWCMKFSLCGRLLATAGQDCILRIWVLRDKHGFFSDMRRRYQVEHEGLTEDQVHQDQITEGYLNSPDTRGHIFMDRPFVTYTGHTSDLLDISWSNNFFILTSSMDKTVRLWHISRKECLCVFQHIDFVTAIGFHPKNDKFFISGSLDGKIRLWNIPDKKVALWNEVDGTTKLITAANFCQNGKFAVVGTYDGRCIFYSTDQLKYHTTIHVRSTRGKNSRGRKVTGIEPMPGEDKILVTSTDSRIRLYDLRDLSPICKYRGYTNLSSQIRACFSPDGRYICAGSENHCVFLWSSVHVPSSLTARKDRNNYYEAIKAHNAAVTCTLFAPVPELVFEAVERGREAAGKARENEVGDKEPLTGYVVISGDYDGDIKVFIKEGKKQSTLPRY